MKLHGYIQPTPATAELWAQLRVAKSAGDHNEVGRLTSDIQKVHRNGQHQDSTSDCSHNTDHGPDSG